jgi:DNA replication and repair protein RecF
MVRFGAPAGRIVLRGSNGERSFETDVVLTPRESRRARLNGDGLQSAERLRHSLRTLVFTPDRLAVVKGAPAIRRAYLDRSLGRLFVAKAALPVEYAAAVGQRNAALRRLAIGTSTRAALTPWTDAVASLGAELVTARIETVQLLAALYAATAERLGLESAALLYEGEPPSADQLDRRLEKDLERGVTGVGPHLHDLRMEADGRELRAYGSQGEQRVAVLALVLAEADALGARMGATPLVLLDDVLSELDGDRRRALAAIVSGRGQTILTATAAAAFPAEPAQTLVVSPGEVRAII